MNIRIHPPIKVSAWAFLALTALTTYSCSLGNDDGFRKIDHARISRIYGSYATYQQFVNDNGFNANQGE